MSASAGGTRAVARLARVAELVELEQLGRERRAARVTLALVAIDPDLHDVAFPGGNLERAIGIEPTTFSLGS